MQIIVINMKICIYMPSKVTGILNRIGEILRTMGIEYEMMSDNDDVECDLIMVVGKDGDVLSLFREFPDINKPVLGVNITEKPGFLTETTIDSLREALGKVSQGAFSIQEITKLSIFTEDFSAHAVNEVAIFPSKSASLMEYELWIDKEFVWRDYSDGLIVSTPIGSTAYAMSAGGVYISPNARVFEIVPVNSIDISRRPLIIPDTAIIEVRNVSSRFIPEIIVDGALRHKLRGDIVLMKAKNPAKFIKLGSSKSIHEKILRKVQQASEIQDLPPSAKFVLKILMYEGPLTQADIARKTMLPARTVRYALSLLVRKGLVKESVLLSRDARRKIYFLPSSEEISR